MLLTIAFLIFAVQIVAWILLPSSAPEREAAPAQAHLEVEPLAA